MATKYDSFEECLVALQLHHLIKYILNLIYIYNFNHNFFVLRSQSRVITFNISKQAHMLKAHKYEDMLHQKTVI